jgi:hypothetical protein
MALMQHRKQISLFVILLVSFTMYSLNSCKDATKNKINDWQYVVSDTFITCYNHKRALCFDVYLAVRNPLSNKSDELTCMPDDYDPSGEKFSVNFFRNHVRLGSLKGVVDEGNFSFEINPSETDTALVNVFVRFKEGNNVQLDTMGNAFLIDKKPFIKIKTSSNSRFHRHSTSYVAKLDEALIIYTGLKVTNPAKKNEQTDTFEINGLCFGDRNANFPSINWLKSSSLNSIEKVLFVDDTLGNKLLNPNYYLFYLKQINSANFSKSIDFFDILQNVSKESGYLPLSASMALREYKCFNDIDRLNTFFDRLVALNQKWDDLLVDYRKNNHSVNESFLIDQQKIFGVPAVFYVALFAYDSNSLTEIATLLNKPELANEYRTNAMLYNIYLHKTMSFQSSSYKKIDPCTLMPLFSTIKPADETKMILSNMNMDKMFLSLHQFNPLGLEEQYEALSLMLIYSSLVLSL